jgi:hypothetical protein
MRSVGSILERSIVGEGGCFFAFFPHLFVFILAMMMVIGSQISPIIVAFGEPIVSDERSSPEKQGLRESAELIADTNSCHRAMKEYLFKIFSNSRGDNKIEFSL